MPSHFPRRLLLLLPLWVLGCLSPPSPSTPSTNGKKDASSTTEPVGTKEDAANTSAPKQDSGTTSQPEDTRPAQTDTTVTTQNDSGTVQQKDSAVPDLAPDTTPDTAEPKGPTPPQPGVNFPFPQNRFNSRCVAPTDFRNSDVQKAYAKWKNDTVTSEGAKGFQRVKRLASDPGLEVGSTVSEGIAYGMLVAVYMNDQSLFDNLWKYEQQFLGKNGLMDWYIKGDGNARLGTGAASDADEDMAFALLMADKQWGGKGTLSDTYLNIAKDLIQKIWNHEIHDSKLFKPGDGFGDWNTLNISYFAPAYYRLFGQVTGKTSDWDAVVKTVYDTIENTLNAKNANKDNGLIPAWSNSQGDPVGNVFKDSPTHHQYDSCRTPFRIALDYCWNNEPRALAYITKATTFFSKIGVSKIEDGYELNGTPKPSGLNPQFPRSAAFMGPIGVAAMGVPSFQKFLDDVYADVATLNLFRGGEYYDLSWTVMGMLMMSGNFLNYYQY